MSDGVRQKTVRFMESLVSDVMRPPEDLTVSQWADTYRFLSSEASAEAGRWRTTRTPYLKEVMDAFTDPNVRHLVMVAASQVGKTEAELNMIGYIVDQDPGSILFVHPTVGDAKEFARLRIDPMIRDTPEVLHDQREADEREHDITEIISGWAADFVRLHGGPCARLQADPVCDR